MFMSEQRVKAPVPGYIAYKNSVLIKRDAQKHDRDILVAPHIYPPVSNISILPWPFAARTSTRTHYRITTCNSIRRKGDDISCEISEMAVLFVLHSVYGVLHSSTDEACATVVRNAHKYSVQLAFNAVNLKR